MSWMDCWRHCYRCGVSDGNDDLSGGSVRDADDRVVDGMSPDWTAIDYPLAYPAPIRSP